MDFFLFGTENEMSNGASELNSTATQSIGRRRMFNLSASYLQFSRYIDHQTKLHLCGINNILFLKETNQGNNKRLPKAYEWYERCVSKV